jgi:hypothetical protein
VSYSDAPYLSAQNNMVRSNFGLARGSTNSNPIITDLFNKFRASTTQGFGIDFYIQQMALGAPTGAALVVQSTNFYPFLALQRHTGRSATISCYFRVMNGAVTLANVDNVQRILLDGMPYHLQIDAPARIITAAMGWQHMQAWVQPVNGVQQIGWPLQLTASGVVLFALPALVNGFETIPWDIGPMPSYRVWR